MEPYNSNYKNFKIFLSHAGEDWQVVYYLYQELLESFDADEVFFDKESLRPGDSIQDILGIILERTEVAVVTVSESFVTKKWPILELEHLIRARRDAIQGHRRPLTIIPIFCGLEPGDLTNKAYVGKWWIQFLNRMLDSDNSRENQLSSNINQLSLNFEEESNENNNINRDQWNATLREIRYLTAGCILKQVPGMYKQLKDNIKPLVSHICNVCPPTICNFSTDSMSYVGCKRMVQKVHQELQRIRERSNKPVITLGVYGASGSGKSTISKAMVDFYKTHRKDLYWRSYYLELPSKNNSEEGIVKALKHALKYLASVGDGLLNENQHIDQAVNKLKAKLESLYIFLAIDNVQDWNKRHVQKILKVICGAGSTVMVTSHSIYTLKYLNTTSLMCVPIMEENEAWEAFMEYLNIQGSDRDSLTDSKLISNQLYSFVDGCHPKLLFEVADLVTKQNDYRKKFSETISNLIKSSPKFREVIKDVVISALNINGRNVHARNEMMQQILNILHPDTSDVQQCNYICMWSKLTQEEEFQQEQLQDLNYIWTVPVSGEVHDHGDNFKYRILANEDLEIDRGNDILTDRFPILATCCEKKGKVWGIHGVCHEFESSDDYISF